MHLSEFKAWFDGFTEEMKGPPNKDQWEKIKKRVKEITADYTPAPVFIDRYVTPWRRYWEPMWLSGGTTGSVGSNAAQATAGDTYRAALSHAPLEDWSRAGKAEFRASL